VAGRCIPTDQASAVCCPARSVQGDTPISAAFSRLPVDPNGPCEGQTLDLPVIFPEPDGLLTEDGGP